MAITTLDPTTALVIVDLQQGIISYPTAHPTEGVVENAATLADVFRRHGLPVVLVNVDGVAPGRTEATRNRAPLPPNWTEFAPVLNRQPQDTVITKRTWCAFTGTGLDAHLKALGVTQVVLTGIATSVGVESTARTAYALGYNVTLATDAMTDLVREAHDNSIARIFPKLGETGTTQAIIDGLERRKA